MLTSSDHSRDIRMAYEKNVAGYFLKSEIDPFMATLAHYVANVRYPLQPKMAAEFGPNSIRCQLLEPSAPRSEIRARLKPAPFGS